MFFGRPAQPTWPGAAPTSNPAFSPSAFQAGPFAASVAPLRSRVGSFLTGQGYSHDGDFDGDDDFGAGHHYGDRDFGGRHDDYGDHSYGGDRGSGGLLSPSSFGLPGF
jgi:hypothetical protein